MTEYRAGQNWLLHTLNLNCPPAATESWCGQTSRKTIAEGRRVTEKYPAVYAPDDTVVEHLKFSLKNETLDMGIIFRTMQVIDPREIEIAVRDTPKSAYVRRIWFLYEWFTGRTLDLADLGQANYVNALDEKRNIGSHGVHSSRHKVIDNMLGTPGMCITVQPSKAIADFQASKLDLEARNIVQNAQPELLERAIQYLFTKETKSSFEIEHEEPTAQKAERFVAALRNTASFDPSNSASLLELQNAIVDPRFVATGLRDFQNYVGQSIGPDVEKVHFICPKPEDVPGLMTDWSELTKRLRWMPDPVVAATIIAFAFVYIHPYEDGNGRIHRFLLHNILSREGFTPPDFLFPISAAIVRDTHGYDAALESFSKPVLERTHWAWDKNQNIVVKNDTAALFRYFDATEAVEFIYRKIEDTVQKDLREELDYIAKFDVGYNALRNAIDMPNKKVALFVKIFLQSGVISKKKRPLFHPLNDADINGLVNVIARAIDQPRQTALHENDEDYEKGSDRKI